MNYAQAAPAAEKASGSSFALPSGATLHLSRPSFAAASQLRGALARAFGAAPLRPEEMKATLASLKENPSAGGALFQRALNLVASSEVEDALFRCLEWGLYQPPDGEDRVKVDRGLFDHPQYGDAARADLYPMFYHAAEVAVKPFLLPLVSMYKEFQRKGAAAPASPSTSPPSAS